MSVCQMVCWLRCLHSLPFEQSSFIDRLLNRNDTSIVCMYMSVDFKNSINCQQQTVLFIVHLWNLLFSYFLLVTTVHLLSLATKVQGSLTLSQEVPTMLAFSLLHCNRFSTRFARMVCVYKYNGTKYNSIVSLVCSCLLSF